MDDISNRSLEFDVVRERIAENADTEEGKNNILSLFPLTDRRKITRRLMNAATAGTILTELGMISLYTSSKIPHLVSKSVKGGVLTNSELLECADMLSRVHYTVSYIREFDFSREEDFAPMKEIFGRLVPNDVLHDRIVSIILSDDEIADTATPALASIRKSIRNINTRIKNILQKYISSGSEYLQENIYTVRNGRYVIPVKSEHKGDVKGLVHDISSSGSTLFIEPSSIVDANNELKELQSKEEKEVERILATLSASVSDYNIQFTENYRTLIELDTVFAVAKYSKKNGCISPEICEERKINLIKAKHPLLNVAKPVPVTITIDGGNTVMLITGPNTGGKTVTLKTVGLFAMMVQSGLQIPVDYGSQICIFDNIYADIGDNQSIAQSLSTFSSHMKNIIHIINDSTENSLVLFDELCSGTDPVEGSALATAILETIRKRGTMCVATTHYSELKKYALETEHVVNASCEFDIATLKPTYRLIIGVPGKSNAFSISEKLGLPKYIIDRADTYIDQSVKDFEKVISELDEDRTKLAREKEDLEEKKAEFEKYLNRKKKEIDDLYESSEKEYRKSVEKSQSIISEARITSEFVFKELDRIKKEKDSDDFGGKLSGSKKDIRKQLSGAGNYENTDTDDEPDDLPFVKGDKVVHRNLKVEGTLMTDPDKSGNVTVMFGFTKSKTNIKDLKHIKEIKNDKSKEVKTSVKKQVSRSFDTSCDIRGMNGDEGCMVVDRYLDDAQMAGIKSVTIIHGKGTGVLRKRIEDYLKSDKRVRKFRPGQFGEGDFGVTVVDLK